MPKFIKGGVKPEGSGRVKGTPNKRTFDAQAIAEEIGIDPLRVLLYATANDWEALGYDSATTTKLVGDNAVTEDTIPIAIRIQAAKEAAQYLYSKRKAVEHTGMISHLNSEPMTIEKMIEQLEKGEL